MGTNLTARFRMPVSFGPAAGPRNLPEDQRHRRYDKDVVSQTISARTDPEMLARFLPQGLTLDGDARIEVCVTSFRNIGWLAGRGYDILMVRIPVIWRESEDVCGSFVPVVWENMADPIITGREELGWPKIFANIALSTADQDVLACSASWDGHRFFELEASGFGAVDAIAPPAPMVFHKFIPATGASGEADADYLTITASDGPAPQIKALAQGNGRFAFHPASWEDMPTQYIIVNALAALPLCEFGPVTKVDASGGGDGSKQRKLPLSR